MFFPQNSQIDFQPAGFTVPTWPGLNLNQLAAESMESRGQKRSRRVAFPSLLRYSFLGSPAPPPSAAEKRFKHLKKNKEIPVHSSKGLDDERSPFPKHMRERKNGEASKARSQEQVSGVSPRSGSELEGPPSTWQSTLDISETEEGECSE